MIFCTPRLIPEKAVFRPALALHSSPEFTGEHHMAKLTYSEQLRHPNWQRRRLEVMKAAGFECENCGDKDSTLNVHHRRYVKGRMVWEYDRPDLVCLCEQCHQEEHEERALLDLLLVAGGRTAVQSAVGLLGGWLEGNLELDDISLGESARQVGGFTFDFGIFGTMLNQYPDALLALLKAAPPAQLNPAQQVAILRWQEFVAALEKGGL